MKRTLRAVAPIVGALCLFRAYAGDTLAYGLEAYVAAVLVSNRDLSIDSFAVSRARLAVEKLERRGPFSLDAGYEGSGSNRLSTDAQDGVSAVSNTSNRLNAGVSRPLRTGGTITASYGYANSTTNSERTPAPLRTTHTSNASIALNQPLLGGFLNQLLRRSLASARKDLAISQLQYRQKLEETLLGAVQAYFGVLQAQAARAQAIDAIEVVKASMETEEELVRRGFEGGQKLLELKTQLLKKQNDLFSAENALETARSTMLGLVDRVADTAALHLTTEPMVPRTLGEGPGVVDSLFALALKQRTDVEVVRSQREKAEMDLVVKKNGTLPELDLSASYYFYGTDPELGPAFSRLFSNEFNSWSVGLNVSTDLGGVPRRDALHPYKLAIAEADHRERSLHADIRAELTNLVNATNLNSRQFVVAGNNRELAVTNLAQAEELYNGGFIQFEELSRSQSNLETSEIQLYRSRCEYTTNYHRLLRAVGGLLEEFGERVSDGSQSSDH